MVHPIVGQVIKHFGPTLRFVFRHFPPTQIHPNAESAAEAVEFAGAHHRFWDMHDAIYENQDRLGTPLLRSLARALRLSELNLAYAISAGEYSDKIRRDFLGGVRSGVNGTPIFFFGNQRHDGGFDLASLVMAIEARLEKATS